MTRSCRATRDAYGEALLELGQNNDAIYVVDCDIGTSCRTAAFGERFPQRHLNVGIAEQNACGVAAGLACCGKIPFVTTYAVFGSMRMCEQLRQSVCYPRLNVKLACSHGGLTPCNDGASHQGIEDMGILRTLPNMTVVMGADFTAAKALVRAAAALEGPVYLRFTRDPVPQIYRPGEQFRLGEAKHLRDGEDITLIANGEVLTLALTAAERLAGRGISAQVLDMHTIKPLDTGAVVAALEKTGRVITLEDHNILGGLGSAVCEVAAQLGRGTVRRIGIRDRFGESGPYEQLLADNGITVKAILAAAEELLN